MSTSFVKKINTAPQLYKKQLGVKSYANQQYSVSSGNQSLDHVLGGGFPIGSIVLLFEDSYSQFYAHFLKTFLGEGIVNEHKNLIIDPDTFRNKDYWLKFLPAVIKIRDTKDESKEDPKEKKEAKQELTVAWRYNNLLDEDANLQQNVQTSATL